MEPPHNAVPVEAHEVAATVRADGDEVVRQAAVRTLLDSQIDHALPPMREVIAEASDLVMADCRPADHGEEAAVVGGQWSNRCASRRHGCRGNSHAVLSTRCD